MTYIQRFIVAAMFAPLVTPLPAWGGAKSPTCDAIADMDYLGRGNVPSELRWQDDTHTLFEERILRLRNGGIPLLIGCLADERKTKRGVWDLWPETTVGMIAFSMLWDLFTASMGEPPPRYTVKGVIEWDEICSEAPPGVVNACVAGWYEQLKKYGPRSIQQSWQKAWTENKDRIYWDGRAKCFRVKKRR